MSAIHAAQAVSPELSLQVAGPAKESPPGAFEGALGQALQQVETYQSQADHQADLAASGAGNLHETALALEKADTSMRVLMKVRNKVVDAYQEVMRMSV
jgi:flagellar hook-basal body complex protein FliE